jgi:hypothetical protein
LNIGDLIAISQQYHPFKIDRYSPRQEIVEKFATTGTLASVVRMASHAKANMK